MRRFFPKKRKWRENVMRKVRVRIKIKGGKVDNIRVKNEQINEKNIIILKKKQ